MNSPNYRKFMESIEEAAAKPFPTYKNAPKAPTSAELSAKAHHESDKAHSVKDSSQYKYVHADAANAHDAAALAHEHDAAKSTGHKKKYHEHMVDVHKLIRQHHNNASWNHSAN